MFLGVVLVVLEVVLVVLEVILVFLGVPGDHWASSGTHSSGPYSAVVDYTPRSEEVDPGKPWF